MSGFETMSGYRDLFESVHFCDRYSRALRYTFLIKIRASQKNVHLKSIYQKTCISNFFGPYSKTCIVEVRAAWGRVSRGLTVAWNAVDLTFAMVTSKTHHFPRQTASIEYAWNLKNSSNDRSIISRFFKTLGLDWWSWDHLSSFSFNI